MHPGAGCSPHIWRRKPSTKMHTLIYMLLPKRHAAQERNAPFCAENPGFLQRDAWTGRSLLAVCYCEQWATLPPPGASPPALSGHSQHNVRRRAPSGTGRKLPEPNPCPYRSNKHGIAFSHCIVCTAYSKSEKDAPPPVPMAEPPLGAPRSVRPLASARQSPAGRKPLAPPAETK